MRDPCAVKQTVSLASRDRLEGLRVPLPVKDKPLVVTQQFVLALRLEHLFLVGQIFLFSTFIGNTSFHFVEMFLDLLRSLKRIAVVRAIS